MWETLNTMQCKAKGKLNSLTALSTRYHYTAVFSFLQRAPRARVVQWNASPNQEIRDIL